MTYGRSPTGWVCRRRFARLTKIAQRQTFEIDFIYLFFDPIFTKVDIFQKMSPDEELLLKEKKLLEIQNRIGYIDGNIDQERSQNAATVWFTGHGIHSECILFWNLAKLKREYNRLSKIDYFVIPLFVTWCIIFITMAPLETNLQVHSIYTVQNQTIWGNKTIPGSERTRYQ